MRKEKKEGEVDGVVRRCKGGGAGKKKDGMERRREKREKEGDPINRKRNFSEKLTSRTGHQSGSIFVNHKQ